MGDPHPAGQPDEEAWVEDDDTLVIEDPKQPPKLPDSALDQTMIYLSNPWVLLLLAGGAYTLYQNRGSAWITSPLAILLSAVVAYILYFNPVDSYYLSAIANHYMSNPWFLLVLGLSAYILYRRVVRPRLEDVSVTYQTWQETRRAAADLDNQRQNPDAVRDRMEAMERARARQQAAHEAAAQIQAEKEREREEARKADKLKKLESLQQGKGYNNKASSSSNKLNDDYSPLMGMGGSGGGFRPARRGPAGGGGGGG